MGFLVDKVALGQVYVPMPYSPIHQRRYVNLTHDIISNYNIPTLSYEAAVANTQQECLTHTHSAVDKQRASHSVGVYATQSHFAIIKHTRDVTQHAISAESLFMPYDDIVG